MEKHVDKGSLDIENPVDKNIEIYLTSPPHVEDNNVRMSGKGIPNIMERRSGETPYGDVCYVLG
ncbi:hypothetical protein Csa_009322 [Cucumis sativus]|uniref:Uncharacterized protein n=1 Tax=Cucumis sativus TaxID=3659 RepID=A0A0A0KR98_CUCSA|nr:hypothetical protein Csa_009322 [Cucumis sativus]